MNDIFMDKSKTRQQWSTVKNTLLFPELPALFLHRSDVKQEHLFLVKLPEQ